MVLAILYQIPSQKLLEDHAAKGNEWVCLSPIALLA